MIENTIRYSVLFLVLCNIPAFLLTYFGGNLGPLSSILTSILLLLFIIISRPLVPPPKPFILIAILYFTLSSFNFYGDQIYFLKEFIRVLILIIGINQVMYKSNYKDIYIMMLICATSIIINGLIFPETNKFYGLVGGRFSGFLLNPNTAGIACLVGMAISYSIKKKTLRLAGQLLLTFGGILTLSRTFILVWIIIVLFAIIKDKKNSMVPIVGLISIIIITTFTSKKIFAVDRFEALTSFFQEGEVKTKTVGNDTRDQTWALYYDAILENPILGNGFKNFQIITNKLPGVHNTYLMIIGESGILSFLLFIGIYFSLLKKCIKQYKDHPILLYILIVIMLDLMVAHNYFFIFIDLSLSIFVYTKLKEIEKNKKEQWTEISTVVESRIES